MVKREGDEHVKQWKKDRVRDLADVMKKSKVVGIVDIEKLPSAQFQEIKKRLRGKARIVVTRKSIILRAVDATKSPTLLGLEKHLEGPIALIVSEENPFALYKFLKDNKSRTSAKAGDVAEADIIVPAGETELPAGPALAELKLAKIDVKLDKGKIVVSKDSLVAKKGDAITAEAANALSKLGITPVEIWLHANAFHEDGVVYGADVLDIDETAFMDRLMSSHRRAVNLAVNAGYPTTATMPLMITRAHTNAINIAVNANIYARDAMSSILSKFGEKGAAFLASISKEGY